MILVPPPVRAVAAERGLGTCEARFRFRPGAPGVLGFTGLLVVAFLSVRTDPTQTLGVLLFAWAPFTLGWAWFTAKRLRSGLYVFTGGLIYAYGEKIKAAVPWADVVEIDYRATLYLLNFIPYRSSRYCRISLHGRSELLFDSTCVNLSRAVFLLRVHTRTRPADEP
ncbi:hypothetical protein [Amycolatopsis sp. H20-H5]|uniref:hypothetical protein n=1 Tax=Amycolatopsis sp. H20-H5 TaxID=3046309 RepID=UPI002DBF5401|nr:hypothetical protein [Amycolatopsis sp. H20-H5]MEC3980037.1 hypothetical protein [Amycolatopsis sp. H20-H5]